MDEEEAVKNVTQKKKKKIKDTKSCKGEKNEESLMGIHKEGRNINDVDAIEHVQVSGKYEVAEIKRDRKTDKVKKIKKGTDFMADSNQSTEEGELLTVAYGEEDGNGGAMDNVERKRKKREKKLNKHDEGDSSLLQQENVPDKELAKHDSNGLIQRDQVEYANKKKKKKTKKKKHTQLMGNGFDALQEYVVECEKKEKKTKLNDATPIKSNKKVRFSDENEFFPISGNSNTKKVNDGEENLVRGKRFTPEEDKIVRDAVFDYIERHDLGDEGLDMVLNCKKYRKLRGCWKEIASAIPYRPYVSVYLRAQNLFCMGENRKWTQEEYDKIMMHQAKHGNKWRPLADELGKYRVHVSDAWRRIKLSTRKKGHWSQDEYQKLFDLVNVDLQAKISEPKISKHGMLRDNICWTAISDMLLTRIQKDCCRKWYGQLTSRMVAEGEWADTDDYRLIGALYSLDATCMGDVEWDSLVEGRTGDVCQKRWGQMILHIGKHGHKSFAEQVEVLGQRYCLNLLEAREIWDSKPRVP
ncbi:hypothetical protein CASFOL_002785 [Castilleja foliolosa]|uniref:Myb-like domain-containing protein n=1 Tax=Castilleja foliolosa TaxID=1961234 RepID=A0ABD3EJ73_9LAMI